MNRKLRKLIAEVEANGLKVEATTSLSVRVCIPNELRDVIGWFDAMTEQQGLTLTVGRQTDAGTEITVQA